jgi:drug/metabolite transporter (DMT)-like permease
VTSSRQLGLLFLLITSFGWGLNWPVIKLILQEWPPLFARGAAGLVAALGLGVLAVVRGQRLSVPHGTAGRLAIAAILNVFGWMGLSTLAMVWLIPTPDDQNPWAQSRSPSDMMRQGWSVSLFQAAQQ